MFKFKVHKVKENYHVSPLYCLTWLFFSSAAILKGADLETLSAKKVRQQLEQELGVDLSDRKKEIDAIIMADVEDQVNSHSEEEEVSEEETNKGKDESESEPEPDVSVSSYLGCSACFFSFQLWF